MLKDAASNHADTQIDGGCTLWARQTIESEIFADKPDKWFKIWFYLVNKANHKNNRRFERGTVFATYEWIADATKATKAQIHHCIRYFKSQGMIITKKAVRGMYITIVNYDTYQTLDNYLLKPRHSKRHTKTDPKPIKDSGLPKKDSEQKTQQKTHKRHTKNNNDKNEKKYSLTSNEVRLSTLLLDLILENKPDYRLGTPAKRADTIQRWAVHIGRLIRLDERIPEQVETVIRWSQQDDFWWKNILSGEKLRKQFDKLEADMQGRRNFTAKPLERDAQGRTQGDILRQQLSKREAICK